MPGERTEAKRLAGKSLVLSGAGVVDVASLSPCGFVPRGQPWPPSVLLESPYRSIVRSLLEYLDRMERQDEGRYLTVVLPEFIPFHWWEHFLHNQTAFLIKASLLFRPGTVSISVPYHLGD